MANDPFCDNCGYNLRGLTESSKCPECGRPIVEVLQRPQTFPLGRRYRSQTTIFGLPLVSVAFGPHEDERIGRACGIIAIGDVATGWLAIGGFARGIFAAGGCAIGLVSAGGLAIGLLIALGGATIGGLAVGGMSVGGMAIGGGAAGFVAEGGFAVGYYSHGGSVYGKHVVGPNRSDPEAVRFFSRWGQQLPARPTLPVLWHVMLTWGTYTIVGLATLCFLLVVGAYSMRPRDTEFT
ncbi:MAG: hypothetical protein JXO22_09980 [Phycisphaerae bacterium]|nr:hypothetical protein [Phycisphaerae bacterium]